MIEEYGKTLENIPQANYTTYKLSGKIKKVIYPSDVYKLKKLLEYLNKDNIKYKVIGNGSNIIFDGDYDGVIIKLDNLNSLSIDDDIVKVGAGYNLMKLALKTADNSLSGLEFASGIPGTVGGAIYMNAGAYNSDMSSIIVSVNIIDDNNEFKTLTKEELDFGYRNSILKTKKFICIGATLKLKKDDKNKI